MPSFLTLSNDFWMNIRSAKYWFSNKTRKNGYLNCLIMLIHRNYRNTLAELKLMKMEIQSACTRYANGSNSSEPKLQPTDYHANRRYFHSNKNFFIHEHRSIGVERFRKRYMWCVMKKITIMKNLLIQSSKKDQKSNWTSIAKTLEVTWSMISYGFFFISAFLSKKIWITNDICYLPRFQ